MTGETVLGVIPVVGKRLRRKEPCCSASAQRPEIGSRGKPARSLPTRGYPSISDARTATAQGGDFHHCLGIPRERQVHTRRRCVAHDQPPDGQSRPSSSATLDLRALPALADLLGTKAEGPGLLSSASRAPPTLEEAIHRDEESGLHVLMTKPSEPRSTVNAADILSSKRFDDMIEELESGPTTW